MLPAPDDFPPFSVHNASSMPVSTALLVLLSSMLVPGFSSRLLAHRVRTALFKTRLNGNIDTFVVVYLTYITRIRVFFSHYTNIRNVLGGLS